MKATALAPANIAFIKYWGKADPTTRVPQNNSISMNLSNMFTITTVEFSPDLKKDEIVFMGEREVKEKETQRIIRALDQVRKVSQTGNFAKVVTKNNFPKATGIASSASGFASLAQAAFTALDYSITEKELSKFCRQLSGTACRSIPGGFVEWQKGTCADDSYGYQLYPPEYWDICDVVAVVTKTAKKVGSTEGHAIADTSPFYEARMQGITEKIVLLKESLNAKNFTHFGEIIEHESLNMHAICLTSQPPLLYWESTTLEIMKKVIQWRETQQVESYFTIDAGPSVHVICEGMYASDMQTRLQSIPGVQSVTINHPAQGAHTIEEHLF